MSLKSLLNAHVLDKNTINGLFSYADPLQIAREINDDLGRMICALFAYGNARQIVKFLKTLDFSLINSSEENIVKSLKGYKYRFQNEEDIKNIFITLRRLKLECNIEELILKGLKKGGIEHGINEIISKILSLNNYMSSGYEFFFGRGFDEFATSPYKRYNMYLRWMVRDTDIDLGVFKKINKSKLLIPLDVHTHRVSLKLGLIKRKSYDFKAVMELTNKLRSFDPIDPIKYDFALYRIGQSKELEFMTR